MTEMRGQFLEADLRIQLAFLRIESRF